VNRVFDRMLSFDIRFDLFLLLESMEEGSAKYFALRLEFYAVPEKFVRKAICELSSLLRLLLVSCSKTVWPDRVCLENGNYEGSS